MGLVTTLVTETVDWNLLSRHRIILIVTTMAIKVMLRFKVTNKITITFI